MKKIVFWFAAVALMSVRTDAVPFGDFVRPSRDFRPETWFHLIGGNVAKEGLEADLDAIRAAGIRGIQFFHGQFGGVWPGMENRQIPCLSPKWEEILSFVAENCERKGLVFKMQNCPGWSMSGGPWIRPENAMRNLTYSRTEVTGDGTKSVGLALAEPALPTPENPCDADGRDYRDLFVLAFPTPVGDGDADLVPTTVSDGRFEKALAGQKVDFRPGENPSVELGFADPVTIRAIELPSERQLNHAFCYDPRLTVRVEAKVGADWTVVAEQPVPPGNWEDLVPQTVALDERTSDRWRLTFLNEKTLSIPYLRLRSGARLNNWEALAAWTLRGLVRRPYPRQNPATWVDPGRILDLTESFRDGTLRWTPPPGKWTVLRIGHVNNGMKNGPAPKEATGWECNKLDPAGIDCNFNAYIGRFADGVLKGGRLKGMVVDSWECRRQTWTARMEEEFRTRAGYDLRTHLPAVFGYVLGSPDATERFLLDWRRTIGALVEENYYRRFVELGHEKNLHVQYETAMGDVMPGDVMRFWKWADTPMCEFWSPHDNANGFVGSHDFKPVVPCVSAAHLYGKRRVDAEAFTSMGLKWDETLRMLKGDANRHFARGVTHLVFHTYTHNPRTDWKLPGTSFGHCIGTPFIRGQVWWRYMPEFTDYCARCTTMLERGDNVADVLRYLGDELGHRPSEQEPTLPGYKADYLNTDALTERLTWRNGAFETPEGLRWRVLWVPDCVRLLPSSMARLAELAGQGARIAFDRLPESAATAAEGADAELARQAAAVRKGANVTVGIPLADVVKRMGLEPDVKAERIFWNHRRDERSDWYFIAAEDPAGFAGEVSFRTTGPVELWDAVTGERRPAAARTQNGRTVVALDLARAESTFVVFRPDALPPAASAKRGAPVALEGPWTLAFPSGWGAPASVEVAALRPLRDLPELDDEAKAFSGTVSYRRSFASDGKPVSLDLGDVASVAEVFVNGRKVRTLWAPPYRCDLSGFTRPGANELRVDVTDTWFNRLAYDAKLPEPTRKTWTIAGPKAGTPLRTSGLLGPVRLLPAADKEDETSSGFGPEFDANNELKGISVGASVFVTGGGALWRAEFSSGTNREKRVWVEPGKELSRTRSETADGITLEWKSLPIAGEEGVLDAKVRIDRRADRAQSWTIEFANRSSEWALLTVEFPRFNQVAPKGQATALLPWKDHGARLFGNWLGTESAQTFPYLGYYPQVAAFFSGTNGLYVAAEDPDARQKSLRVESRRNLAFVTPVEWGGVKGKAAEGPRYPVVLAPLTGDWWAAASRYRAFALKQKWCAKGLIKDIADYPRRMAEIPLWINVHCHPAEASNLLSRARGIFPNFPTGLHWHLWQHSGHDVNYPEFFPAQPGTEDCVKFCMSIGQEPMPYTNGRLWSASTMGFRLAEPMVVLKADGSRMVEKYAPWTPPLGVMCPSCPPWQGVVRAFSDRVLNEVGFRSIFVDQIGAAAGCACYDPLHSHPAGGGKWWCEGYDEMLKPIRRAYNEKGAMLTTEGCGEAYIGMVDGFLEVVERTPEDVPFMNAVYSGYTTYFCSPENTDDDAGSFRALQTRELLWGNSLGWFLQDILDKPEKCDILRQLCEFRQRNLDAFAYGTLLDEIRFAAPIGRHRYEWRGRRPHFRLFDKSFKLPPSSFAEMTDVIGNWWRKADGGTVLMAANLTDEEQEFCYRVYGTDQLACARLSPYEIRAIEIDQ